MKLNTLIIIFFFYLFYTSIAYAKESYALVLSTSLSQSDEFINGFSESFPDKDIYILDLKGNKDEKKLRKFINNINPSVIISIGILASSLSVEVENKIPIIFAMVINYKKYDILRKNNVTGISMEIPPQIIFTQLKMILPDINSIGVPFHPEASLEIVNDAQTSGTKMGIDLIKIPVKNPDKIDIMLSNYSEKYKGIWMIADTKLYNPSTKAFEKLVSIAEKENKPLIAFSEAFIKSGALFSVSINYHSIGSQTALISKLIVHDKLLPSNIPVATPIGTYTVINKNVAYSILGNSFNESIYENIDKVYP
ncbi:MAG: hypothetical protein HQK76_19630 [Desulfobacterales bacterium]|nr:hypothetical protein [Desulfobacterales bacterium]